MRLYHFKTMEFVSKKDLVKQYADIVKIATVGKKDNMINYVYEYDKLDLYLYMLLTIHWMREKKVPVTREELEPLKEYFGLDEKYFNTITTEDYQRNIINNFNEKKGEFKIKNQPFIEHHDDDYLKICYYILLEKCLRKYKGYCKKKIDRLHDTIGVFVEYGLEPQHRKKERKRKDANEEMKEVVEEITEVEKEVEQQNDLRQKNNQYKQNNNFKNKQKNHNQNHNQQNKTNFNKNKFNNKKDSNFSNNQNEKQYNSNTEQNQKPRKEYSEDFFKSVTNLINNK